MPRRVIGAYFHRRYIYCRTGAGTLVRDACHCRTIAVRHARTFSIASRLLPADKRRGAFALYAFCRGADDIVDRGSRTTEAGASLLEYRAAWDLALAGSPSTPVHRELLWAIESFSIPPAALDELLNGVARDLVRQTYDAWPDLLAYCEGVAASVGEMCAHIFGVGGDPSALPRAVRSARKLGVAMQLTNILRDVGEDAAMGRVYLPAQDLAVFGLTPDEVVRGTARARPGWSGFISFEIERARRYYREAAEGIPLLAADAQACAIACADGYARILEAIEANAYDNVTRRAQIGWRRRADVLWGAWRGRAPRFPSGAYAQS